MPPVVAAFAAVGAFWGATIGVGAIVATTFGAMVVGGIAGALVGYAFDELLMPDITANSSTYKGRNPVYTVTEGTSIAKAYGRCQLAGNIIRSNDPGEDVLKMIIGHGQGEIDSILSWKINHIEWDHLQGVKWWVAAYAGSDHFKNTLLGTDSQSVIQVDSAALFTLEACAHRGIAHTGFKLKKNSQISGAGSILVEGRFGLCEPIGGGAEVFSRNPAVVMWDFYRKIEGYEIAELDINAFNSLKTLCDFYPTSGDGGPIRPPGPNNTTVRATSCWGAVQYAPFFSFDINKSLTGSHEYNQWVSGNGQITNQRLNVDLGVPVVLTKIALVNSHVNGGETNKGIQNFTVQGSNNAADLEHVTYADGASGWTDVQTGLTATQYDSADPFKDYTVASPATAYRYYSIKIADSHGGGGWVGVRDICFWGRSPRYTFDFNFDTEVNINDAKKLIWSSFNGRVIRSQGKLKPVWDWKTMANGSGGLATKTSQYSFTMDNIVKGSFTWHPRKRANKITIEYLDPSEKWKKTPVTEKDDSDIDDRGVIELKSKAYYITQQDVAARRCRRQLYRAMYADYQCELTGFPSSQKLEVYDLVEVTHTLPDWTTKQFIVLDKTEDEQGRPTFLLETYYAGVFDDLSTPIPDNYYPAPPNPYDPPPASTSITATLVGPGGGYDYCAVKVAFSPPGAYLFYSHTIIYASKDDTTYYCMGESNGEDFVINGMGTLYSVGDTCYVKLTNVSTEGVAEEIPDDYDASVAITSVIQMASFYAGIYDFWGGNAAIDHADTKIVLGNLDGTPKIALGTSADTLSISNMATYAGFFADGDGYFRGGGAHKYIQWNGEITIKAGADFLIDSANQKMTLGSGNNLIALDAADATYRLAIGHASYGSAPFSVTKAGALKAESGTIAAWTLAATTLTSANITLDQANDKITVNTITIDGANNRIRSDNYVSGYAGAGFTLEPDLLEVGNIACRGIFRTAVFQKDTISVVGGNILVRPGDVLATDMPAIDSDSWDLLDEDCADISDWVDVDTGTAVSEVSPAGQFRFDTNAGAAGNAYAYRRRDIGSIPATVTFEIKLYHDAIGTTEQTDYVRLIIEDGTYKCHARFGSNGIFIYDGAAFNEVGNDLVKHGGSAEWQTWRFAITMGSVCDIYLKDSTHEWKKVGTDIDCSYTAAGTDGNIKFYQFGHTTDNMVTHVDYIKVETGKHAPPFLTIEGNEAFAVGDFLRIKDGTNDEWLEVTNVASAPTYVVTRDKGADYAANSNPAWAKGATVVNYGASGDGGIYMTASETNAPYLSIYTHAGSPWNTITTHMRMGNLNGYAGYVSDVYGWAAYIDADNYIKIDPTNGIRMSGEINISSMYALPSDAKLVGYWPFDEGSGAIAGDGSENGHYGTITNATWAKGYVGQCLNFDGTGDYVTIDDHADLDFGSGDFSISFWASLTTYADTVGLITKVTGDYWTGIGFRFTTASSPNAVFFKVVGATNSVSLNTGIGESYGGTHFVGTRSGNVFTVYVNGVLIATDTVDVGDIDNNEPLYIGKGASGAYNGKIDEVRMYKGYALTASEVKALYLYPAGNKSSIPTSLDSLADGVNYGRVLTTSISAGLIVLSEVSGDLDDIANGTYGKVLTTAISAGKIILSSAGVTGTLPTSLTIAKCTVAHTDPAIANALEENNTLTISRPVGTSYSGGSSVTGVIKITLPQSWTNTMMKFVVDVFELTAGISFSLELAGYNYAITPAWSNTTANLVGSTEADNRVRFGHDGTKCCICIGETTSNWNYLKAIVRDFQAGYMNYARAQWEDGWSISIVSSLTGYTFTSDISDALIDANIAHDTSYVNGLASTTIILAGKIGTGLVVANSVVANAVTASKISVTNLSAISANLGSITAGIIQSTNWAAAAGMQIDLNSAKITIRETDGLEIDSTGGIKVLAGGDIELVGDGSNAGKLVFQGTSYGTELGCNANGTIFAMLASNPDITSLFLGYSGGFVGVGGGGGDTFGRFNYIEMEAKLGIRFRTTSPAGDSNVCLFVLTDSSEGDIILQPGLNKAVTPYSHKSRDFGKSNMAWNDAYADDWHNVADFYNFDIHDDLAAINGIKGSGAIDKRTGHELIDDNTLPLWLLSKYKQDGEIREQIKDKDDNMTDGELISIYKKGDVMYDLDGKPYLSLKTCVSLSWGAIRQLDSKIEALNEKLN